MATSLERNLDYRLPISHLAILLSPVLLFLDLQTARLSLYTPASKNLSFNSSSFVDRLFVFGELRRAPSPVGQPAKTRPLARPYLGEAEGTT